MSNRMLPHFGLTMCLYCLCCCYNSEAQNLYPVSKITWHLSALCSQFTTEVIKESNICNSEVIDEVHDHAENVDIPGYNGDLVEDYLDAANNGLLCYADGLTVRRLKHACDCMQEVCDRYAPRNVDRCSKIVLSPFAPNAGNGTSQRYGPAYNCYGYRCLTISPALMESHAAPFLPVNSRWMTMMVAGMATVAIATIRS